MQATTNSSTSTEERASQETHRSCPIHQHNALLLPQVSSQSSCLQHKNHTEILTLAILDTQSDSTFILEDVLDKLNVNVQPVKLKLDTIISSKSVHGLQVQGLHLENGIQLQQVCTRDFIPVDKSYVPTKETALLWPHLRNLADKLPPSKTVM